MQKIILTISIIVLVVILLIGGAFYWFQFRPTKIRKECWAWVEKVKNSEIENNGKYVPGQVAARYGAQEVIDNLYNNCLRERGLEK